LVGQLLDSVVGEQQLFQFWKLANFFWERSQVIVSKVNYDQFRKSDQNMGVDKGLIAIRKI